MDERTKNTLKTKHKNSKKGFALLLTLSVLSIVISLTMVLLSYFNKVRTDAQTTKALIQADVFYADILEEFKRFKKKPKTIFTTLYHFPVSLRTPDGRFFVTLKCQALGAGVNINWLALEHDLKKQPLYLVAEEIFDKLALAYNLEDADRLRELIIQEIAKGKKFVSKAQSRLRQKAGIISYQQFSEIVSRYQLEVDDPQASKIAWSKYFSFADVDKIDAEYSSPELISVLFDVDLKAVREWYYQVLNKPSLQSFVNDNGGEYALKKNIIAGNSFLGASSCSVDYGSGYRFTFKYIKGESKHFEFYGK